MGITGLASFLVLVWIGSGSDHPWWAPPSATTVPTLGEGVVSGVFVAAAGCAAMVTWRRHAGAVAGWIVATGALVAGQALAVTLIALHDPPPHGSSMHLALLVAALVGMLGVVVPLLAPERVRRVVDETFVIGLGLGLVAAGHLLLQFPRMQPSSPAMQLLIGVLIATHLLAAVLVLQQRVASTALRLLLLATVGVVVAGQLVPPAGLAGGALDAALWAARTAIGAAWLGIAWARLRRSLEDERRRLDSFEHVLVDSTREQRERLHELRSTVAGLVSGSALLDRADISPQTRERLWASVRRELDRMERMLTGAGDSTADLRLDDALAQILDLQRLKGRRVELHATSEVVRARFDALAEVLNILVDNAVKHGGTDASVVEVTRRDEDTVDITVTDFGRGIPLEQRPQIFDWGRRGKDSRGEGIGLNVAQRLMTEAGGSLRLAEREGAGSSFVISLPAARGSAENGLANELAKDLTKDLTEGLTTDLRMEDDRAGRISR
ncbi:HAMP domain-containing sensor histidine kinase [Nocardioides sp. zg-1228]|uniref:sensor histidine kinase n=1 Tax=Nocardioides sp. zg-1228 TaxID=2763008 RepID=UPI001642BB98|nr:HAMP domain-containing sensor histidine kinase [Nocardioides sp. zg-1228]MBC2931401.1 HAMP domain-containing histidine kinase [Nocardioides sp. zg-1228]QSF57018.1 HAMP domain-containing histidine kinase [Nocardioides sp. zg-1228]